MNDDNIIQRLGSRLVKSGGGVTAGDLINKMGSFSGMSNQMGYGDQIEPTPPYQRFFSPLWLYELRRNSSLINNACEEKIGQTFRKGFTDWEKAYDAKCPACEHEFKGLDAFRDQMEPDVDEEPPMGGMPGGDGPMGGGPPEGPDDAMLEMSQTVQKMTDDDIDLDKERTCPECGECVEMLEPDESVKEEAQEIFDRANESGRGDEDYHLDPGNQSSVGQSLLEVFEEIAWDLQSFDDGWMLFERSYHLDQEGVIHDFDLEEVERAAPELMRYSIDDETGKAGGEYWVCPRCRTHKNDYFPDEQPGECRNCGNKTYEVYAYMLQSPGGDPHRFFIRGEFVHDSEYERKKWYGFSPILSLWEEARTLEQMDKWYNDAYEERRAPRGALSLNVNRDEQLRNYNRQQMEKLRADPNYIPLFMNGNEGEDAPPIEFIELLKEPAEMQHMEMREWFLDRIAAKYGVTSILMSGAPENSGLSQSMEVEVSQKSAERLRKRFNETYLPAVLSQIGVEGWDIEVCEAFDEDESEEAQLVGQHLNNAQKALQMGAEVEWTDEDRADIKRGMLESPDEGQMDMMGMEGGIGDQRGPAGGSLGAGEHANMENVDEPGERAGPDPDDESRPAATPLKAMTFDLDDEYTVEKEGPAATPRAENVAVEVLD